MPESVNPAVADSGGWPRLVKISLKHAERPVRLAAVHHRKRLTHRIRERDPDITASIATKKSKIKTAESGAGWYRR